MMALPAISTSATPLGPSVASSTAAVLITQMSTMSQACATSAGLAAGLPPPAAAAGVFSGSMSKPTTAWPVSMSRRVNPSPIRPSPMKPTALIDVPLRSDGLAPHSASRSRSAKANAKMPPRGAAPSHRIGKPQSDTRALRHVLAREPAAELAGQTFDEPQTESPRPCAAHAAPRVVHRQRSLANALIHAQRDGDRSAFLVKGVFDRVRHQLVDDQANGNGAIERDARGIDLHPDRDSGTVGVDIGAQRIQIVLHVDAAAARLERKLVVREPDRQHAIHHGGNALTGFVALRLADLQPEETDNQLKIVLHPVLEFAQQNFGVRLRRRRIARSPQRIGLGQALRKRQADDVGKDRERINLELVEGGFLLCVDFEYAPMAAVHEDRDVANRDDSVLA